MRRKVQRPGVISSVQVTDYLHVPEFLVESYEGLLEELAGEARQLQPWRPNEFDQRAAALHEASHCVVAAREGYPLKSARIFRSHDNWLGDFWIDRPLRTMHSDMRSPEYLAHLRIALAGRRGELLFRGCEFCLRAGLEELAYVLIMIMPALAFAYPDDHGERCLEKHYAPFWGTMLAEVDETLLAHSAVVHAIAEILIKQSTASKRQLASALAAVPARTEPPRIRSLDELSITAHDPLAHGKR